MPRTARAAEAGLIYHVLNRGNGRQTLFRTPADFDAFERVLAEGLERYPVDLFTWCLMGNHWHLVVRPRTDDALARLMGWVGVTHVRRHHARYRTGGGGHLYQGRYKSFPVQDDGHFLTLCRYVEANPLRAKLVRRAEHWRWSGLGQRGRRGATPLRASDWPVGRPRGWSALVNEPVPTPEAERIRASIVRGRPLGGEPWVRATAKRLHLEWTLRPRGRPRKGAGDGKE
jgi:putative transposase